MFFQGLKSYLRFSATLHKILLIFFLCCVLSPEMMKGDEKLSCNVSVSGNLSVILTLEQKKSVKELIVTGELDARDFKCMRDALPAVVSIDIEQVQVKAYQGNEGTSSLKNNYLQDEIPDNAFYQKGTLKSVKLPLSVKSIGTYAFYGCKSLEDLYIHKDIIKIGDYAFFSCENLRSFNVDKDNPSFSVENGALFNKIKTILYQVNYSESGTYVVPSTVAQINKYAFYACQSIKEVLLPVTLKQIGYAAFMNCSNLESIKIPGSVKFIGEYAFAYCSKLTLDFSDMELNAPISAYAFYFCKNVKGLFKIKNQSKVSPWSFYKCENLDGIEFSDNVCSVIGEYAFSDNISLKGSIKFPESVKIIDVGAFSGCKNISQIEFNSPDVLIEKGAFRNCSNLSGNLNLPWGMKIIRSFSFVNCKKITNINFPDSLQRIGDFAFANCVSLSDTLRLPEGLKIIGKNAFESCNSFNCLILPGSIEMIDIKAFVKCDKIEEIVLTSDSLANLKINIKKVFSENTMSNCKLKIPQGSIEKFINSNWRVFKNIIEY